MYIRGLSECISLSPTHTLCALQPPCATELPVFVRFTETYHLPLEGRSRLEVSSPLILSGCIYEAQGNLLWTPHDLVSLGALSAQIPTPPLALV